jgi:hypothetical protein
MPPGRPERSGGCLGTENVHFTPLLVVRGAIQDRFPDPSTLVTAGVWPPPGVGPAACVVPPSAAPRDAPQGAASDEPYDATGAGGGRGCSGR